MMRIAKWIKARPETNLLLLGAAEVGKSTFLRHMRIIHGRGYSDEEKKKFIQCVRKNIIWAMQSMIKAMELLKIEYTVSSNQENADLVSNVDIQRAIGLENRLVDAIRALWNDPGIQECYNRSREYQMIDSVKYYLSNIDRIACCGYLPTEQDILRVRIPTTDFNEYPFDMDSITLRIVDVCGYRDGRRGWIDHFENLTSIMFVAALSEYDQNLLECDSVNRMRESLALYRVVISYRWFEKVPVILLLNKKDLLKEKILVSDLVDYFPEYEGPKQDYRAARDFILGMYKKQNENPGRKVYSHFTCATDAGNMMSAFVAFKDSILEHNLLEYGLE